MERQHIIFNLDDTLIECNKYFKQVTDRFTADMSNWFEGAAKEEIRQKQTDIDLEQVDRNGLASEHFAESFIKTYIDFCKNRGMEPDEEKITYLRNLGNSVFEIPVEPLPDMYETLEALKSQGHELYLHTGGDEKNQRRKIAQLQIAAYFDNRIFVSLHKDTKALEKILDEMRFDRKATWMIGNSPKTDIIPALELGVNTIYIPAKTEWHYNLVDIDVMPRAAYITLKQLKEVPEAIQDYLLSDKK